MESFLSNRQQRTKINNAFSRYSEIRHGVPHGSILGPLLFNIYICDIFFDKIECDIASYADDNTPYNFGFHLDNVINNLEKSTNSLLNWFRQNHMKANADKCHLLVSSDEVCTAKIEDFTIENSTEEKLLGVKFDSNLSFEGHVTCLCKKASQKLRRENIKTVHYDHVNLWLRGWLEGKRLHKIHSHYADNFNKVIFVKFGV